MAEILTPTNFERELNDPMKLTYFRHQITSHLARYHRGSAEPSRGQGSRKAIVEYGAEQGKAFVEKGILSSEELNLSLYRGMILPPPIPPYPDHLQPHPIALMNPTRWAARIAIDIETWQRPVYVVMGVFDVFHGGHWLITRYASLLAQSYETAQDRLSRVHPEAASMYADIQEEIDYPTNKGGVYILLESDRYGEENKREPIFPALSRVGWFAHNQFNIDGITIWPSTTPGQRTWEEGFSWIDKISFASPIREELHKWLTFVIPDASSTEDERERETIHKRERQLIERGFGVAKMETTLNNISTTILVDKFNLKPLRYA